MDFQWFMAARKIGKRLASLEPPTLSELSDETHEVICGVAGCVVKKRSSDASLSNCSPTFGVEPQKSPLQERAG